MVQPHLQSCFHQNPRTPKPQQSSGHLFSLFTPFICCDDVDVTKGRFTCSLLCVKTEQEDCTASWPLTLKGRTRLGWLQVLRWKVEMTPALENGRRRRRMHDDNTALANSEHVFVVVQLLIMPLCETSIAQPLILIHPLNHLECSVLVFFFKESDFVHKTGDWTRSSPLQILLRASLGLLDRMIQSCRNLSGLPSFHAQQSPRQISLWSWFSCSVGSDSYDPMVCIPAGFSVHGILQVITGVGLPLLQGIFPTQGSNPQISYQILMVASRHELFNKQ